jgi:hypothetical protein
LETKYTFDLDKLPVYFGTSAPRHGTTSTPENDSRDSLNEAMRCLVEIIWEKGGFRFFHRTTRAENLTYRYYCCQDSAQAVGRHKVEGKRDGRQMERFPCESNLTMRPSLQDRTLFVSLCHTYHIPYKDIMLPLTVTEFIDERITISTPSEIYRDLEASELPGTALVTRHQVYYRWQLANRKEWRRDADPFTSATLLLVEHGC